MVNLTISLPNTLTDLQKFWWPNVASWQSYWNNAVVILDPLDLPLATITDKGCIKQANTTVYTSTTLTAPTPTDFISMSGVATQVANYAQFAALLNAFNSLQTNYINLKNALVSAGVINY